MVGLVPRSCCELGKVVVCSIRNVHEPVVDKHNPDGHVVIGDGVHDIDSVVHGVVHNQTELYENCFRYGSDVFIS